MFEKKNNKSPPKTNYLNNSDQNGCQPKDSDKLLQMIRKMFVQGEESKANNSDYENSISNNLDVNVGRSCSILTENGIDRNKYL
jgi:hypothetical protein